MAADIQSLTRDSEIDAIELKENQDPLGWISQLLNQRREKGQEIQELHLMAHGSSDGMRLGSQLIDTKAIIKQAKELANWQIERLVLWSC